MKMHFTETRHLEASTLRKLCILHDWYTCGDNEEYGRLFDRLRDCCGCPENLTTEKLVEIAEDIWEHSDIQDYTIETVLHELARACYHRFDVVA